MSLEVEKKEVKKKKIAKKKVVNEVDEKKEPKEDVAIVSSDEGKKAGNEEEDVIDIDPEVQRLKEELNLDSIKRKKVKRVFSCIHGLSYDSCAICLTKTERDVKADVERVSNNVSWRAPVFNEVNAEQPEVDNAYDIEVEIDNDDD
jgi:hypothetical protein